MPEEQAALGAGVAQSERAAVQGMGALCRSQVSF